MLTDERENAFATLPETIVKRFHLALCKDCRPIWANPGIIGEFTNGFPCNLPCHVHVKCVEHGGLPLGKSPGFCSGGQWLCRKVHTWGAPLLGAQGVEQVWTNFGWLCGGWP